MWKQTLFEVTCIVGRACIAVGCDLGLVNFGFSIIHYSATKQKVLHRHLVVNRVTDFKERMLEQRQAFYLEIRKLLRKYKPKILVVERFMTRGRFGQAIGECLTFMLAVLAELCHRLKIEFKAVTSASWKNAFQRRTQKKLDNLYKYLKPLPPHIVDSVLQATYGLDPTYQHWSINYLKKAKETWQN
jgi:Holliday junction resolvasome RuvABC endonuclease subunit